MAPCLSVSPFYISGRIPSHVTEILQEIEGNIMVHHDQTEELVEKLLLFKIVSIRTVWNISETKTGSLQKLNLIRKN